jgi:protein TonB
MNGMSVSFHNEMNNALAQRALKLTLVLGLHAVAACLIWHAAQLPPLALTPIRVEMQPMEVFLQSAMQVAQPAEHADPVRVEQPRAMPKAEPLAKSQALSSIARPVQPDTSSVEPLAVQPLAEKGVVAQSPAAPKPMPFVAAHADANYAQKTAPTYPTLSRRLREEGKVLLMVSVNAKGDVESAQVKQTSGYQRLDDAALVAVRSWRFVPARRGEVPVADDVIVPVQFKLND